MHFVKTTANRSIAGSVSEDSNDGKLETPSGDGACVHFGIAPSARPAPKKLRQNGDKQAVEAECEDVRLVMMMMKCSL